MKKHHLRLRRLPGIRGIPGILIFLLLGSILNVAVAWGITIFDPYFATTDQNYEVDVSAAPPGLLELHNSQLSSDLLDDTPVVFKSIKKLRWCADILQSQVMDGECEQDTGRIILKYQHTYTTVSIEVGWPFQSLWGDSTHDIKEGLAYPTPVSLIQYYGIYSFNMTPFGVNKTIYLPATVRWWASAGNTLFYAIVLWLPYLGLIQGFHLLRRHRRHRRIRRRGRCVQCEYLVAPNIGVPGASPNCPECGTPIPEKRIKTSPE